jgi:hypothetical protein
MPLHHLDVAWTEEEHLVEARQRLLLSSVSTKPDHPVPETGQSSFYCFEQGLLVSVRFVWQHIFATPLGNRLLQARQA